jgi:hypothetical protein
MKDFPMHENLSAISKNIVTGSAIIIGAEPFLRRKQYLIPKSFLEKEETNEIVSRLEMHIKKVI